VAREEEQPRHQCTAEGHDSQHDGQGNSAIGPVRVDPTAAGGRSDPRPGRPGTAGRHRDLTVGVVGRAHGHDQAPAPVAKAALIGDAER
jgi:hypothetical protein